MPIWTTEAATTELTKLIDDITELEKVRHHSAPHMRWLARMMAFLEEVFGMESDCYRSLATVPWKWRGGQYVLIGNDVFNPDAAIERKHQRAYLEDLDSARGVLQASLDQLERKGAAGVYKGKNSAPEASQIIKILNLIEHKLRKVIRDVPEREKQVQDAVENLLVGADIPYSRETDSIEYSSKTYIPDFTVPKSELAIEIKLCPNAQRERALIGEINDDILAYKTKYANLLFVIYDCGHIRDVERFVETFERDEKVLVRIVKH
jgi:hypothetical protein